MERNKEIGNKKEKKMKLRKKERKLIRKQKK